MNLGEDGGAAGLPQPTENNYPRTFDLIELTTDYTQEIFLPELNQTTVVAVRKSTF